MLNNTGGKRKQTFADEALKPLRTYEPFKITTKWKLK